MGNKRGNPERLEQYKIAEFLRDEYPDVLFTSSIAGLRLPRHLGANLSQAGYTTGTPDLMIFHANKNYHGLFIEVKTEKGSQTESQKEFEIKAKQAGYQYKVCYGREEGIQAIKDYMK